MSLSHHVYPAFHRQLVLPCLMLCQPSFMFIVYVLFVQISFVVVFFCPEATDIGAVSTSCREDLQKQEMLTFNGELCQLGLHILVQRSPLLQLGSLLLVAVPQVPQGVVQLHLHLSDDAHLQAQYATLQQRIV